MITHFHRDHLNGFIYLAERKRVEFEIVYIPYIFTVGNHPNMVDFLLIQYILERYRCSGKKNDTPLYVWELLLRLVKNKQNIKLVFRKENAFLFAERKADVLWPDPSKLNKIESEFNALISKMEEKVSDWIFKEEPEVRLF